MTTSGVGRSRDRWRRRLLAGGAGVTINAALLVAMSLIPPPPILVEPSAVEVVLAPREVDPRRQATPTRRSATQARQSPSTVRPLSVAGEVETVAPPDARPGLDLSKSVEPRWRVDGGAYLDPVQAKQARRAWEAERQRRYLRTCLGDDNAHMTEREKDACWDHWGGSGPAQDLKAETFVIPPRP